MRRGTLCLTLAGALAACAPRAPQPPAPPPDFQDAYYRRAAAAGQTVWRADPARSLIAITVRRDGSLARLGHDHVVASHGVTGHVAPEQGRADLHFRLDQLSVDETALRAAAGLDTQPSAAAIDATRRNMLDHVLDAGRHPFALIRATRAARGAPLGVTLTLHGRSVALPVLIDELSEDADGIAVGGSASLNQSALGIVPFSVLGGALAVRDRLELRFRIVARKQQ